MDAYFKLQASMNSNGFLIPFRRVLQHNIASNYLYPCIFQLFFSTSFQSATFILYNLGNQITSSVICLAKSTGFCRIKKKKSTSFILLPFCLYIPRKSVNCSLCCGYIPNNNKKRINTS